MSKDDVETSKERGVWKDCVEGGWRASNTADTIAGAQAAGRQMAIDPGVEPVIKNFDGTVGARNTDPRGRDKNPPRVSLETS